MKLRYKYRLYPNKAQEELLRQFGGACRYLWNQYLEKQKLTYSDEGKFMFYSNMCTDLVREKKTTTWLQIIHSQVLQQKLQDLDAALKNCFRYKRGFPKFKAKRNFSDSFRYTQGLKNDKNCVYLPKIGWVKRDVHRKLPSKPTSATVIQDGNKWYISFVVEVKEPQPKPVQEAVGIDLGLKEFLVTSDGEVIDNPRLLDRSLRKLRRKQRQLSKKKKGSNNRKKQQLVVYNQHKKIRNQRLNFLHQVSSQITNGTDLICTEDLNVAGMQKNHRLARQIGQAGWSMFVSMLEYKSRLKGKTTIKIDRYLPSSKTCSACGKQHDLTLQDRWISCECGLEQDRDANAAVNIRRWGIRKYTEGTVGINASGDTSAGDIHSCMSRYVSSNEEATISPG